MIQNWFSNFEPFDQPLFYQGILYKTPEHFYQAMKCHERDLENRLKIAMASTPGKAKRIAHELEAQGKTRKDWKKKNISIKVMRLAQRFRFAHGTSWYEKLTKTEGELVEWNNWHDTFWGVCVCRRCGRTGENNLGKLLMEIWEQHRTGRFYD